MSEEMKNKAIELLDEETGKVSGGLKPQNQGEAYCEHCRIYYACTYDENGKASKHNCPPDSDAVTRAHFSMN
jgi:hypothetical protein